MLVSSLVSASMCENIPFCAGLGGRHTKNNTHKTLVSCGFEARLGKKGRVCLLHLPKSWVTCLFDSLLRTDTFLRDGVARTLEAGNLSSGQCARVLAKIPTTTLASGFSSCFLSQTTAA